MGAFDVMNRLPNFSKSMGQLKNKKVKNLCFPII